MTREEFIEKHKHELNGLVVDAAMGDHGSGALLAAWLRATMKKIDALCGQMYDAAQPPAGPKLAQPQPKRTA